MTKPCVKKNKSRDDLKEALAVIISSTRTKTRTVSLAQLARWLDVAVSKLGSYRVLADRVGVSAKMLRQFSYISELAKPVRQMFERRELDSVDAAAHLKLLPCNEQIVVARALAEGAIDTADVRAIAQLRRARQADSISSLVDAVRKSKTRQQYVAEFVVRGTGDPRKIRKAFETYISPKEIIDLHIDGPIGRLTLSREGKAQLFQTAKRLGVRLKDVMPEILRGHK
jgi:hypothetical protein